MRPLKVFFGNFSRSLILALVICGLSAAFTEFGEGQIAPVSIQTNGANVSVTFPATQGASYRLERKLSLTNEAWQGILGVSDYTALINELAVLTDSNALNLVQGFYRIKQTLPCDPGLASNSTNAFHYAQAMELCETTTEEGSNPGVITARLTLASGTGVPAPASRSLRSSFGNNNWPRAGLSMVVLSTGAAAAKGQVNPSFHAFQNGLDTGTSSPAPADWLAANGGAFPVAPGCPNALGTTAYNPVMLSLRIRVPHNARSFSLAVKFFSADYPEWVCSQYNDLFVALLDSTFAGSPGNPADKNLAVYTDGSNQKFPMGVNLAQAGLLSQCVNGTIGCSSGNTGSMAACVGTSGLTGTGMDDPAQNLCNTNSMIGGGTDWLTLRGNVVPGEIITLRLALWDVADVLSDSLVLLDNFQWSASTVTPGMTLQ